MTYVFPLRSGRIYAEPSQNGHMANEVPKLYNTNPVLSRSFFLFRSYLIGVLSDKKNAKVSLKWIVITLLFHITILTIGFTPGISYNLET